MQVTMAQTVIGEISNKEAKRIAIKFLHELCGWDANTYVDYSQACPRIMLNVTYATSHSWSENIFIRTATDLDLAFDRIRTKL